MSCFNSEKNQDFSEAGCPLSDAGNLVIPEQPQRITSKLLCPNCSFENDLINSLCVSCKAALYPEAEK